MERLLQQSVQSPAPGSGCSRSAFPGDPQQLAFLAANGGDSEGAAFAFEHRTWQALAGYAAARSRQRGRRKAASHLPATRGDRLHLQHTAFSSHGSGRGAASSAIMPLVAAHRRAICALAPFWRGHSGELDLLRVRFLAQGRKLALLVYEEEASIVP